MKEIFTDLMIYAGIALMACNICGYVRFSGDVRRQGSRERERNLLLVPILLLILFLTGYVLVAAVGHPDLIVSGILFGGSIFVFVMLLVIRNAFERIRENERLSAKLTAAEEASRAKTFFLSNMSHDIRTPLNAITGYTALAKQEGVSPEEQRAYILKIEKAGSQLLELVNDVLEMSRIESGKLELDPTRIDLEECVRDAGDLVRTQLSLKQIDFSVSCGITHKWVLCDRNLLNRALMNLLCNAGKFTDENGSVSLSLTELSAEKERGRYEIRVKDTGIGMSPDFVEHLFSPFEREKTSTVSRIQGTGLGMAITKNIINMMGGTIEVETEQGRGTEFVIDVSFPLESPGEEEERTPDALSFGGLSALLVEDNPVNLEIARMLLTQAGFRIETAENGQIAVETLTERGAGYYDVILMDVQMPVMDGYAAARVIRSLPDKAVASVPIIAMTANAFQEDIRKAEEAGMNGHIAKPLDIPVMMETIRQVLQRRERTE